MECLDVDHQYIGRMAICEDADAESVNENTA
jgi:hypothetical protein